MLESIYLWITAHAVEIVVPLFGIVFLFGLEAFNKWCIQRGCSHEFYRRDKTGHARCNECGKKLKKPQGEGVV